MAIENDMRSMTEANRLAWDNSAAYHESAPDWRRLVEGFSKPGFSTFDETMTAALKAIGIEGKSAVQIGCNNGREILSAMNLGAARGLGIDQSAAFLRQAEELKQVSGIDCAFLHSNIFDVPSTAIGEFDLALITIGVLNWMPDLPGFFRVVASLLRTKGQLLVYETHPFLEMFEPRSENPYRPSRSYFRREPLIRREAIVYDGAHRGEVGESYWFNYTLGALINACVAAGMSIESMREFEHSNREVDYDLYEGMGMPMCFTLSARKA